MSYWIEDTNDDYMCTPAEQAIIRTLVDECEAFTQTQEVMQEYLEITLGMQIVNKDRIRDLMILSVIESILIAILTFVIACNL